MGECGVVDVMIRNFFAATSLPHHTHRARMQTA